MTDAILIKRHSKSCRVCTAPDFRGNNNLEARNITLTKLLGRARTAPKAFASIPFRNQFSTKDHPLYHNEVPRSVYWPGCGLAGDCKNIPRNSLFRMLIAPAATPDYRKQDESRLPTRSSAPHEGPMQTRFYGRWCQRRWRSREDGEAGKDILRAAVLPYRRPRCIL
jgi:hypothetical protein